VNLLERIERHFAWRADIDAQEAEWHREFGCLMRAQRVAAGLTLRDMGACLNEAHSAISDYENGNRRWTVEMARNYLAAAVPDKSLDHGVSQTT
jgi:predicted transcriptional regulator